jgi:hypothetical protein
MSYKDLVDLQKSGVVKKVDQKAVKKLTATFNTKGRDPSPPPKEVTDYMENKLKKKKTLGKKKTSVGFCTLPVVDDTTN